MFAWNGNNELGDRNWNIGSHPISSSALAFGLESWIASARLCDRRSSLISALALQSHDSSLKILPLCAWCRIQQRYRIHFFIVIASRLVGVAIHKAKKWILTPPSSPSDKCGSA
ncbi:hypothetical protein [Helicobacter canis]|uniref:hypothetical protein n=1 Tax=Helicobacter canis TaxID=29419 RepID=UPI0011C07B27|nr:hypothetical protein [Helicobacter canis]